MGFQTNLLAYQNQQFMNVYYAKFMIYFEIHRLKREGLSIHQISKFLVMDRRTVTRYLSMSEQDYENFLLEQSDRKKTLAPYEDFVRSRLETYRDTPAAQMHDWLKEHFAGFPAVSPKTVFNFVCWIRHKYNLPRISAQRQHLVVEEMPYGKQAQVDFGEYNLRTSLGKRTKVCFFTLVLSRSRFKYVWFTDRYFTSELAIKAHEQAFAYIRGIPDEIVYDQDKVFIVSENKGDIILTDGFRAYTRERSFKLYFCRKADPQSKGKVENLVKYVKQNFLYNRTYHNIDTLNDEAMGWLGRTANALPHAFTKKEPHAEWVIEQPFLKPYIAYTQKTNPITYTVRKDNTISFKSNLYSLPLGTYKGRGSLVAVRAEQDELVIADHEGMELCRHRIASGKGLKIINTNHKRDKSAAIDEMIEQLCALLENPEQGRQWLAAIHSAKPRYIRDQLLMARRTIEATDPPVVNKALDYCLLNKITSATDFKAIVTHYQQQEQGQKESVAKVARLGGIPLNPLNRTLPDSASVQPDTSSIKDYQALLKKQ